MFHFYTFLTIFVTNIDALSGDSLYAVQRTELCIIKLFRISK